MPTFITITSQKGGVAKTTSAVSLAHYLARQNSDVLLIDFDSQGNAATALGLDPAPGIFNLFIAETLVAYIDTNRSGLTLLPGNQKTKLASSTLYMQIASGDLDRQTLIETLRRLGQGFDYVIMDTPASGIFQELALEIANSIVIPTELEQLSMTGVASTMATIAKLNPHAQIIVLPTMYDMRINEHRYNLGLLNETYPGAISEPVMNSSVVKEATASGQTIWEYSSKSASASLSRVRFAYEKLAQWIIETPEQTLFGEE